MLSTFENLTHSVISEKGKAFFFVLFFLLSKLINFRLKKKEKKEAYLRSSTRKVLEQERILFWPMSCFMQFTAGVTSVT